MKRRAGLIFISRLSMIGFDFLLHAAYLPDHTTNQAFFTIC